MSKEIFLYSKNKKYKCAVELADSCDHFGCPDNSVMILFEERKDGTYIIAQARDKRLETEKDRIISDLEAKLAESKRQYQEYRQIVEKDIEKEIDERIRDTIKEFNLDISQLKQQIAEKEKEINKLQIFNKSLNSIKEDMRKRLDLIRTSSKKEYIRNMEQQLEEKETRIAELEDKDWYEGTIKQLEEGNGRLIKQRDSFKLQLAQADQDKISFAVEQLNLLYETLTTEDVWRAMKKSWWLNNGECLQLRQTIDNQIKQLRGVK